MERRYGSLTSDCSWTDRRDTEGEAKAERKARTVGTVKMERRMDMSPGCDGTQSMMSDKRQNDLQHTECHLPEYERT